MTTPEIVVELVDESPEIVVEIAEVGERGPVGPGVPVGGLAGEVLRKTSDAMYDTEWDDILASPDLTGVPTAPTAAAGTSTTQIATTAFTTGAIDDLVNGSPIVLDTLKELADALGDDPNFAATTAALIGTKLAKASNLSDVADVSASRTNLGLGTAALLTAGILAGQVPVLGVGDVFARSALPSQIAYEDQANTFVSPSNLSTPIVVQGAAGQTVPLQQWQDSTTAVLAKVTSSGSITSASPLVVGDGVAAINARIVANTATGNIANVELQTAGLSRWKLMKNSTTEGGSNAGSNFSIRGHDDSGASLGDYLTIARATGAVSITASTTANAVALTVSAGGTAGAQIALLDTTAGASTPNKYIKSQNGELAIVNSANTTKLLSIADSGLTTSWNGAMRAASSIAATGYAQLNPGTTTTSGYISFYQIDGNRAGYIGNSTTTGSADAGTLNYQSGLHSFGGRLAIASSTGLNNNVLSISAGGTHGAEILLNDTTVAAPTPKKYLRAASGAFYVLNDSSTPILALGDTGNLTVNQGSITSQLVATVNGAAGSTRDMAFTTSGTNRWVLRTNNTAESGSNAGSDFQIVARDDAGALLGAPLTITRATGASTFVSLAASAVPLTVRGVASQSGDLQNWTDSTPTVVARITASGGFGTANRVSVGVTTGTVNTAAMLVVKTVLASNVGAIVQASASQTADLQDWLDSAGNILAGVAASGGLWAGMASRPAATSHSLGSTGASNTILAIKSAASQTGDMTQWQDSAGTVKARIFSDGGLASTYVSSPLGAFTSSAAGSVPMTVKGFSGQTANLQEWQDSSATVLSKVLASGAFFVNVGGNVFGGGSGASRTLQVRATATTNNPLIVQGLSFQSADLIQAQDSSNTVMMALTAAGRLKWAASANEQTTVGAAGPAVALPATPTKYMQIVDSTGTTLVVPAYAAA